MRAWTPDQSALIAHHEQVNGELADVAKVARDALAEAEIENVRLIRLYEKQRAKVMWMQAELHKEAILRRDLKQRSMADRLERIASGPPTEDPT